MISSGPKTVSNGLTIYLDSANIDSYVGGNSWSNLCGTSLSGTLQGNLSTINTIPKIDWSADSLTVDNLGNVITNTNSTLDTSVYTLGTQSALFNAGSEKLVWPNTSDFYPGTQDFFYGIWARWSRYGPGSTCLMTGFGNGNAANTMMVGALNPSYYGNGISLFVAGNYASYATNHIPSENVWHHVAVSKSGTTYRLFVDGTQRGSWTISGLNITTPFRMGSGWASDGEYLNGYVNSAQLVIGDPVVTGSFSISSPNYLVDSISSGSFSRDLRTTSMNFNNLATKYSSLTPSQFNSATFSMEFWVYQESQPNLGYLFASQASNVTGMWGIATESTGYSFRSYNGVTTSSVTSGTSVVRKWNHVVVTRDATNLVSIYVDGVLRNTSTIANSFASADPRLGVNPSNSAERLNGRLSIFKYYSGTVLSSTDILQNFNTLRGRFGI